MVTLSILDGDFYAQYSYVKPKLANAAEVANYETEIELMLKKSIQTQKAKSGLI